MIKTKKSNSVEERISKLQERGLIIDNYDLLHSTIEIVTTYYHLTGYRFLLDNYDISQDAYNSHSTSELVALYDLDMRLSVLFFKEIRVIEQSLRTRIANLCKENDVVTFKIDEENKVATLETNYCDNDQSNNKFIAEGRFNSIVSPRLFSDLYNTKEEPAIKHYLSQYGKTIPIWVAINFVSFGTLIQIIDCLTTAKLSEFMNGFPYKKSKNPNNPSKVYLKAVQMLRNKISHHSNILDKKSPYNIDRKSLSIYYIGFSGVSSWSSFLTGDKSVSSRIQKEISRNIDEINSTYNTDLDFSIFMNRNIR